MTGSNPPPGVRADTVRWCRDVAAVLGAVAAQAGRLAAGIAADWLDDNGREWAERATLLHRELVRDASAAADLSTAPARSDDAESGVSPLGAGVGRDRRARLGGTDAVRAQDGIGMQVAELPEPGGPPG